VVHPDSRAFDGGGGGGDDEIDDAIDVVDAKTGKRRKVPSEHAGFNRQLADALRADDTTAVKSLLQRHPVPPSREAMLRRAGVAGAAAVARMLMTMKHKGNEASRPEVAGLLHAAFAGGHVNVVEAVRDVLGHRFACRTPGGWPRAPGGATFVHAAADNKAADARLVWLALEAEGEPPDAEDELAAFTSAATAIAATAAARLLPPPPPPPSTTPRRRRRPPEKPPPPPPSESDRVFQRTRAETLATFKPSSATTRPLTGGPTLAIARLPNARAACGVQDEKQVTPLMRAADAGPGWEACVSALLRSAAGRARLGEVDCAAAIVQVHDEDDEQTAAHYAANANAVSTLRLLHKTLPSCARAMDVAGASPLHHAAAAGHTEVRSIYWSPYDPVRVVNADP
jgi:hypothetical protein